MKLFNSKNSSKTPPEYNNQNIKNKWGWGWLVTAILEFGAVNSYYKDSNEIKGYLSLLGALISIVIYFYFRNELLSNISDMRARSSLSGIFSMLFSGFVVGAIAYFFVPSSVTLLTKNIKEQVQFAQSFVDEAKKEDALIWEFYIEEPKTDNELKNNIKIIEKSIPLYQKKDSVFQITYNNIYSLLINAEKKNSEIKKKFPITDELIKSIIDAHKLFADRTIQNFIALKNYYNAVLLKQNNTDELYDIYVKTAEEFQSSTQKFTLLSNKLQGLEKYLDRIFLESKYDE